MRNAALFTSLVGAVLLTGCPDRTISEVTPQQGRVEFKDIPVTVNRDLDILFLIDDSPSMLDKQHNLQMNFPNFVNVLNTITGGLPNIHLGVTTSDLGTLGADGMTGPAIGSGQGACSGRGKNGNLQTYGAPVTGAFISDIKNADGTRTQNYTGTLADAFTAMASAGANGCGFEQHIEAMKQALSPSNTANAGFLRPNAYLALIIVGDEDDCSMEHASLLGSDTATLGPLQSFRCTRFGVTCDQGGTTSDEMNQVGPKGACHSNNSKQFLTAIPDYITFFKGLKTDPSQVIVADIGAPPTPVETELRPPPGGGTAIPALAHSCTYVDSSMSTEVGDPTVRVTEFLNGFPNRSTFSTICQQDLSGALTQIAQLLKTALGSPCIDGKLAMPYDCSVSYVSNFGKPNQSEQVLPECNNGATSTNKPCWDIEQDTANCMGPGQLTLKVQDNGTPPPNTHIVSYCVTETGNCSNDMTKQCSVDGDCGTGGTCNFP